MRLFRFILLGASFLLAFCANLAPFPSSDLRSVEPFLDDEAFQKENLPIRAVSLVVFVDENWGAGNARSVIQEASDLLKKQVGIELVVTYLESVEWKKKDSDTVLARLYEYQRAQNNFDIAVAFAYSLRREDEECDIDESGTRICVLGRTAGWRYIHVRQRSPVILAHEIGHAFLRNCRHSQSGLMHKYAISPYLTMGDRRDFLANKRVNFHRFLLPFERCIFTE